MARQLPPVDDDVFEALQALAEPLLDDINSVLRRLLAQQTRRPSRATRAKQSRKPSVDPAMRAQRGKSLPDVAFEIPVLHALAEVGGRAPASEVVRRVGELMHDQLGDVDRGRLASGDIRWQNRVHFARLRLAHAGDLESNSPRGVWELSAQGRSRISNERGLG